MSLEVNKLDFNISIPAYINVDNKTVSATRIAEVTQNPLTTFSFLETTLNVEKFIRDNKVICALTLGLAIPIYCITYWVGRCVTYLKECFGATAKQVEEIHQKVKENTLNSLFKRIPPSENKDVRTLFKEQVIRGAERLCQTGIKGSLDLDGFDCLVTTMFVKDSHLEIFCNARGSDGKGISLKISPDRYKEKMLYGILTDPKDGAGAVEYLLNLNQFRQEHGVIPISKLFIPFVCEGAVAHGILAVIEIDPNKNVNITVINSMGENTSYRSGEEKLVTSIKQAFPPPYKILEVVHNKIRQQTDGLSCGFQQLRNIQECQGLDSVYEHVRAGKLCTEKRDLHSMEQWFENEIKPKISSFIKK